MAEAKKAGRSPAQNSGSDKALNVDKSAFVETLEKCGSSHVLMLRPHGFGKSHLMDLLFSYYDKSSLASFNEKYAGTYIRMHPTTLKNSFRVLRFVFSSLGGADEQEFEANFKKIVLDGLDAFLKRNPDVDFALDDDMKADPIFALTGLCLNFSQQFPAEKIYLLIEDYDNFAYDVLFENRMELASADFLVVFYESIKSVLNVTIGRTFITGVLPIAFGSLFGENGLNVVRNFASFRSFVDLDGFTAQELGAIAPDFAGKGKLGGVEKIVQDLDATAGGYVFSPYSADPLYNPRDTAAYLQEKKTDGTDEKYQKRLNTILDLSQGFDLKDLIDRILRRDLIKLTSVTPFLRLSLVSSYNNSDLLSLLFYLGYLSMARDSIKKTGAVALVCPNDHIAGFFRRYYEDKKLDALPDDF